MASSAWQQQPTCQFISMNCNAVTTIRALRKPFSIDNIGVAVAAVRQANFAYSMNGCYGRSVGCIGGLRRDR